MLSPHRPALPYRTAVAHKRIIRHSCTSRARVLVGGDMPDQNIHDQTAQTFFEGMTQDGRALFEERLVRHQFPKGRTLIEKGDSVSGAYFVLAGRLRVFTYGPSGKESTLYVIEPGETCVLALNSLFNDVLYPAWVETESPTTVGLLPGSAYRTLFAREEAVQDLTVKALSTAVFRLMMELEQRHGQKLDQRLASFLLMRASGTGQVHKTQQEIAGHIGTSREVVARLLGEFVAQGWVSTGRGQVHICETQGLSSLLESKI